MGERDVTSLIPNQVREYMEVNLITELRFSAVNARILSRTELHGEDGRKNSVPSSKRDGLKIPKFSGIKPGTFHGNLLS